MIYKCLKINFCIILLANFYYIKIYFNGNSTKGKKLLEVVGRTYNVSTKLLELVSNNCVKDENKIYYQCPKCDEVVWVYISFEFLKDWVCFSCQRDVLSPLTKY
jgi:hypothetical protein